MPAIFTIKILEKESNKRGDLFGRLMSDLFLALGYDQARLNIHKTGREIDIEAFHRTEKRRVIAECKATKDKTGGDEINKFFGVLHAEKHKYPDVETIGYFISLSGFKETAIEQEHDAGDDRVILLSGKQVVGELIKGRIIVSPEKAMERAGRCAAEQPFDLLPETGCELLAHDMGWIWAIYFTRNKQRTHFALIHADGESITSPLAEKIVQSDKSIGGTLHSLIYLPPPDDHLISDTEIDSAKTKYFKYLKDECGEMTLEGLPADQEVGSRRLNLEHIFVPLYLEESVEYKQTTLLSEKEESEKVPKKEREPVGKVLSKHSRLAVLAAPGGGKTTLLKRLAVAYAFPERRKEGDDNLPDRSWLPIFIRCRQLGDKVKSPISDIFRTIPQRAEMSDSEGGFMLLVTRALRSGNALLLIDGLDEISDECSRILFVKQLRTFLATYPNVNIVVTSREAGFRIVGGALSAHCKHYKVADFDNNDITRLTLAWHREVVGDRPEIISDAEKLAKTICDNDRVRDLAKNPLLLTTLLLVKRWVGQLPTRRSVLYGKAIEVLLMTWNVEGYEPIEQDEAIPQLAFIAFTMMNEGIQRISSRRLKEILNFARNQMPEVLGYARFSVQEFIQRVESRSSLLMLSGHEVEEGTLYPMYEFRHLTFQEYLTAIAVVNGYYPDRKDDDTLLKILEPHLADKRWKEVVPLAAVLAGRKVQPLIRHLIDLCKSLEIRNLSDPDLNRKGSYPIILLSQCILDEIQVAPDLLKEGLEWIARQTSGPSAIIRLLFKGKYGSILKEVVQNAYMSSKTDLGYLGSAIADVTLEELNYNEAQGLTPQIFEKITSLLNNKNSIQKAAGVLAVMHIAFYFAISRRMKKHYPSNSQKLLKAIGDKIVPILYSDEVCLHSAACWAFAWLGEPRAWTPEHNPGVISRLLDIWISSDLAEVKRFARWAISSLPVIDRDLNPIPEPEPALIEFIKKEFSSDDQYSSFASLIIGFYLKKPWTDEEIAKLAVLKYGSEIEKSNIVSLLKALGEPGRVQLEVLKKRKE